MSAPTIPWYPMTHDDAVDMTKAIRSISGQYDTTSAASIVAAIRGGKEDRIPNGSVFVEHHDVYGDIYFATRARNQHKVAGDATRPTITIQPIYLLSANGGSTVATFQYDRPEAFYSVSEEIPANTVVTFNPTAYDKWTNDPYHFTAANTIPVGSKLCLNGYASTVLTSLKVQVFTSPKDTVAAATYDIFAGAGDATVDLGTFGTELNHAHRVSYGSNNEPESNFFQWLNTVGAMNTKWTAQTKYDMLGSGYTAMNGFLGGFSEEFRSYLGLCSIPNITNDVFESQDSSYTKTSTISHNGYFFLPGRKEIYGSDENVRESAETQFDYYRDIATTNADKLMYAYGASSPTSYWLRTPHAGNATNVRICYTGGGGALYTNRAYYSGGAAPLAILA